uniref:Uncharacterized protein n=1 Tax=Parascaris univalens TaxID=6257 RepID=A0A915BQD4_PARUN
MRRVKHLQFKVDLACAHPYDSTGFLHGGGESRGARASELTRSMAASLMESMFLAFGWLLLAILVDANEITELRMPGAEPILDLITNHLIMGL